jgi:PAS domain S-box-containing protein
MTTAEHTTGKWNESTSAECVDHRLFRLLFDASSDGILIIDPAHGRFIDCNAAAVAMSHGGTREWLMSRTVAELSPERQADGRESVEVFREIFERALTHGTQRVDWVARRFNGEPFNTEVILTPFQLGDRQLIMLVARDISERKRTEEETRRLNQTLEKRVRERTVELVGANEQLKAEIAERRRREKVQQATYQISEAVHTAEDLGQLYQRIHTTIQGLMPASNFYLALEEDGSSGRHYYAYHVDEKDSPPGPRKMDRGLNGYVLRTGKALLATCDSMTDPQSAWHMQSGTPAAIWLGAPLTVRGKTIGVMAVQDYNNASAFGETEKQILTFIAAQTALAIERKKSEEQLRESEEKHRALFEATVQGVMLHDEEQFLEVNPAVLRILGFRRADEIVGKHPSVFAPPHQPGGERSDVAARRHIRQCLRTGSARFDWMCRNAEGGEVPIEVILTRINWGGRQIIQAVINDIRERKAAEEALKQRHREVMTLLNSLPGYVFFKDAQGHYLTANENFCRALGRGHDQVVGKMDHELFPAELAKKFRDDDLKVLTTGERVFVGEEPMVDGERSFVVETQKVPVKNDNGIVVGLIGLGFDVTERKRAEDELLKTLAREKELGQLKSDFVSTVSHEFRTPLGIIMSSAEILDDYFEKLPAEERGQYLRSIHKNSRRMADLMEEVLLLGRIDAGKMDFRPAQVDLPALCRRIVDEVKSVTDSVCPIELTVANDVSMATSDERLLRHIFVNLVTNGVKYSSPGTTVEVHLAREGTSLMATIRDQGIGIPEADQPFIFKAFQRGRNVGNRPGTGLGLMIVKRCVELHDGSIEFKSVVGAGTTFTVRLPVFTQQKKDTKS